MTAPEEHVTLGRFATVLASLQNEESLTTRLCEAGRLMLDSDGSAMTLNYTSDERLTVCATTDVARQLEDLQDVVGEGPGHDAARTGTVVISRLGDGTEDRWVLLSERLHTIDFAGTVLAIPLTAEHAVLGVLTVHRDQPEQEGDESLAKFLGVAVGTALLQDPQVSTHGALTEAWASRAEIHQATGMVVAQIGVRPEDALALLRGQAFARAAPLTQVAKDIIERRINFRDFTIEGD
jgi:GAF domain-containing protein